MIQLPSNIVTSCRLCRWRAYCSSAMEHSVEVRTVEFGIKKKDSYNELSMRTARRVQIPLIDPGPPGPLGVLPKWCLVYLRVRQHFTHD